METSIIGHSLLTLATSGLVGFNVASPTFSLTFLRAGEVCLDGEKYEYHITIENIKANIHISDGTFEEGVNFRRNNDKKTIQWNEDKLEKLVEKINEVKDQGQYKIVQLNGDFDFKLMTNNSS